MSHNDREDWDLFWKFRSRNPLGRFITWFRRRFISRMFIRFLLKKTQKGTLIEAGCGTGEITLRIAKQRGDKVILLDSSNDALEQAQSMAMELNVDATFVHADILRLPEVSNLQDDVTVFNVGVIEHFTDCTEALRAMAVSSVRPALTIVPEKSLFWMVYIGALRKLRILPNDFYVFLFSRKDIVEVVHNAKLVPLRTEQIKLLGFIKYLAVFFCISKKSCEYSEKSACKNIEEDTL